MLHAGRSTLAKKQNSLVKRRVGRPERPFLDEYCTLLIEYMSKGLPFEGFAGHISTCKQTLYTWLDKYPDFLDAKKEGESKSYDWWSRLGVKAASGQIPNFSAAAYVFNMKNRFGWRDAIDLNAKTQHTNVNVNVSVEGKVSELLEEFTKLLDVKKEAVQIKDVTPRRIKSS